MARFVPGPLVSDISGRIGSCVFTSYKGVGILKKAATNFYQPNSQAQQDARAAASFISQQWAYLSDEEQGYWNDDAAAERRERQQDAGLPKCSGSIFKGYRGPFSGFNMFLMRNMARYTAGIKPLTDVLKIAPLGLPRPEGFKSVSAVAGVNFITFSWELITNLPKTDRFKLWIRSIDARVHVQLAATSPCFPEGSITINTVRGVSGIPISLPPGRYELQAQPVSENGLTGVDSQRLEVRIYPDNFKFVFYEPRQLILEVLNIAADIPWTDIALAALVPEYTNSVLIQAELELTPAALPGDFAILSLRRDAASGVSNIIEVQRDGSPGEPRSNNGIQPIDAARDFQYSLTGAYANGRYNIRIYLLAYIH